MGLFGTPNNAPPIPPFLRALLQQGVHQPVPRPNPRPVPLPTPPLPINQRSATGGVIKTPQAIQSNVIRPDGRNLWDLSPEEQEAERQAEQEKTRREWEELSNRTRDLPKDWGNADVAENSLQRKQREEFERQMAEAAADDAARGTAMGRRDVDLTPPYPGQPDVSFPGWQEELSKARQDWERERTIEALNKMREEARMGSGGIEISPEEMQIDQRLGNLEIQRQMDATNPLNKNFVSQAPLPLEPTGGQGGVEPIRVYHGTPNEFTEFKPNEDFETDIIDRWLGTHYAEDKTLSEKFLPKDGGGRIIGGEINPKTTYEIKQKTYPSGALESDQWAIQRDIGETVFPVRPDLLRRYLKSQNYSEESTEEILRSPEKIRNFTGASGLLPRGDLGKEIRDEYIKILKEKGYDTIKYKNTSPEETRGVSNTTSYIKLLQGGQGGVEEEALKYKTPEEFVDNSFKVKPPQKLYRGIMKSGQGAGTFSLGKGLYSTTDKNMLKNFSFDEIVELNPQDSFPRNPLVMKDNGFFTDWLLEKSGEKNIREFNKKYSDPSEFVKSLGYDGVVIPNQEIVKYDNSKTKSQLTDIWNKAHGQGNEFVLKTSKSYSDLVIEEFGDPLDVEREDPVQASAIRKLSQSSKTVSLTRDEVASLQDKIAFIGDQFGQISDRISDAETLGEKSRWRAFQKRSKDLAKKMSEFLSERTGASQGATQPQQIFKKATAKKPPLPLSKIELGEVDYVPGEQSHKFEALKRGMPKEAKSFLSFVEKNRNKISLHPNKKTVMSVDFSTSCPKRESGLGACPYCYVEHGRIAEDQKMACVHGKTLAENNYNGEIRSMPKSLVDWLNSIGGLRMFAFGDYRPGKDDENVEAVLADAKRSGLIIKAITKTKEFVDKYGDYPNLGINISVDNVPREMSNSPTIEQAVEWKGGRDNVKIRTVALNYDEAVRFALDPRVDVVTGYHGMTKDKLYKVVSIQNPQLLKKIGPEKLKAYLDTWENVKPEKVVEMAEKAGVKEENIGKRLCCQGGKCWLDKTRCGFKQIEEVPETPDVVDGFDENPKSLKISLLDSPQQTRLA